MSYSTETGLHFLVGLSGVALNDADRRILRELKPAGVILFAYNFLRDTDYRTWHAELASMLTEVTEIVGREKLLVSIDHEGGRVHRVPPPFAQFPYAREYVSDIAAVAKAMAEELQSIGINFYLGPVADVDSNPMNPVIGARSFGTTSEEVSTASVAFARAMAMEGMLCCGKHFPGHGDTHVDSHLELPILEKTREYLAACELEPFQALIQDGIPAIMSAHILFPALDPVEPATLSSIILKGILREHLRFDGVVVTDDIAMKAIADRFDHPETPGRALAAGCDLLCVSRFNDPDSLQPLVLASHLEQSRHLPDSEYAESTQRVARLLEQAKMQEPYLLPEETLVLHRQLAEKSFSAAI